MKLYLKLIIVFAVLLGCNDKQVNLYKLENKFFSINFSSDSYVFSKNDSMRSDYSSEVTIRSIFLNTKDTSSKIEFTYTINQREDEKCVTGENRKQELTNFNNSLALLLGSNMILNDSKWVELFGDYFICSKFNGGNYVYKGCFHNSSLGIWFWNFKNMDDVNHAMKNISVIAK
jgi:hypothetical protein